MSLRSPGPSSDTDAFGLSESASVIDRHSSFDGTYSTDRDLRIEGTVKGNLSCEGTLHVAEGATVNAEIKAEQVVVAGSLEGAVTCRTRLQIMPSGDLKGKISTPSLIINEGARYEGEMEMPSRNSRLGSGRNQTGRLGAQAAEESEDEAISATSSAGNAGGPGSGGFIRRFGSQEARSQDEAPAESESGEVVNGG
jgi:cytoskeletal protein CcmA (bactofilin family)